MTTTLERPADRGQSGTRPGLAREGPAWSPGRVLRMALGGVLIALVLLPVYRLLDPATGGQAAAVTIAESDATASFLRYGLVITLLAVALAALLLPSAVGTRLGNALARLLTASRPLTFALFLAVLTGVLAALVSLAVLGGRPNLFDAMSQLLHARALAAGHLAIPSAGLGPFRAIENGLFTAHGWVSQYPPGHVLLLALGFRLGAVWLVGPLMAALMVFCVSLAAERLFAEQVTARLGSVLVAISPFIIGLAGSYMNHVSAAAAVAVALYAALRASRGSLAWAAACGLALAFLASIRPLTAAAVGLPLTLGVWVWLAPEMAWSRRGKLLAVAFAGALPICIALAAYNTHFFGAPFRFGYDVAWGPRTRVGFHMDPWGNRYGPLEALGFTSADLTALSLNLLETPLPAVVLVGLYLVVARRLAPGERLLLALAGMSLLANALYWHHGLFMGPRMLNEVAFVWALLVAAAAVGLLRRLPAEFHVSAGRPLAVRSGAGIALGLGLLFAIVDLTPTRLLHYDDAYAAAGKMPVPRVDGPSLVFVHDAWPARLATALSAAGMPLDSVETALRQNDACRLQQFADAYAAGSGSGEHLPSLDFSPRARGFPQRIQIAKGDYVLMAPGAPWTAACLRQLQSDRFGVLDITPLLWQTDIPGEAARAALIVRDRGPAANAVLIRAHPERRPLVYLTPADDQPPVLLPYDRGMALLWGKGGQP